MVRELLWRWYTGQFPFMPYLHNIQRDKWTNEVQWNNLALQIDYPVWKIVYLFLISKYYNKRPQ